MDELRIDQEARAAEAVRPLGVRPYPRQERQQVEIAGGETEADSRPTSSTRDLSTASGISSFIVGISDPYGNDVMVGPAG